MSRHARLRTYLKFSAIALVLLILADGYEPPYPTYSPDGYGVLLTVEPQAGYEGGDEQPSSAPDAKIIVHDWKDFNLAPMIRQEKAQDVPQWQKNAVQVELDDSKPKIVVIIDDLGMDHKRSAQVSALPGGVTMALLPYAEGIDEFAKKARAAGHELIIHMPMEPMDGNIDTGPIAIKSGQSAEEIEAQLDKALASFDGYVGINNHMGSRMTKDGKAMAVVMEKLRDRGLLFVDSKTIASSVAEDTAASYGVPHAARDVFLDNEDTLENVNRALARTEHVAREQGLAIAIGHPKDSTIAGLQAWLPTLAEKGFQLVPVSAVITVPPPVKAAAVQK